MTNSITSLIRSYKKEGIFFIAELGSKIIRDSKELLSTIVFLKKVGVSAVKIQHLSADEILSVKTRQVVINKKLVNLYDYFKDSEMSLAELKKIKKYCDDQEVLFLASFFGEKSFYHLQKINSLAYKIASPESNYLKLWKLALNDNKPIFFSTGVTKKKDLDFLFRFFKKKSLNKLAMLQCVSSYPTPSEEYNLLLLDNLRSTYKVSVGVSDHSDDLYSVPYLAAIVTAILNVPLIIEKHFVNQKKNGLDDQVALDREEIKKMLPAMRELRSWVKNNKLVLREAYNNFLLGRQNNFLNILEKKLKIPSKKIKAILGSGKKTLARSERDNYFTTNRSLTAIKKIKKGDWITEKNSAFLRAEDKSKVGFNYEWEEKIAFLQASDDISLGEGISDKNTKVG